jgi:hypothetical protein
MDIGPVSAIRPVSSVRPSPPGSDRNPDLTGVFAAEFRGQQRDDAYSPSRKATRGLEDEDEEMDSELDNSEPPFASQSSATDSSISFFA